MNLFILGETIWNSVRNLGDSHVVKMTLETGQILSTCHRILDGVPIDNGTKHPEYVLDDIKADAELYKPTHVNHPVVKWAMSSASNYLYVENYFIAIANEYHYRFGKRHNTYERLNIHTRAIPHNIVCDGRAVTPHAVCVPDQYKVTGSAIESYRAYYIGEKSKLFRWTKRDVPQWIIDKGFEEKRILYNGTRVSVAARVP